jgi:antitoxin HicB
MHVDGCARVHADVSGNADHEGCCCRGLAAPGHWRYKDGMTPGYHVVLEPDADGGYVVVVPAFPGCYSQGDTEKEALANAREAILLTIEDMRGRGEPIPDPSGELVRQVAVGE